MRYLLSLFAAFLSLGFAGAANAVLKIDITSGYSSPMPIAVTPPSGGSSSANSMGANIMRVVEADLERSGLFRPINHNAFIEQPAADALPRFADWRQINTQALVTSSVRDAGNGSVAVAFRLWDVAGQQQMTGKEFNTLSGNWRRVGHLIADEIYKRLTGEEGYFDSRIVYVAESGSAKKRIKRLAIMDQDGENHKFLTSGSELVLTPRFSPNSQEIVYMSYASKPPRVYLRDLQTGREDALGRYEGMSFAPRFSANGSKAIFSIAKGGSTQIHEVSFSGRGMRQLTNTPGIINTSPSYSPDGSRIVFNSDRGGSQQLYVMSASGGNAERISFGDGRYGTPVWSPRGDWIAFTKMKGGMFYIGVMRPDGTGERLLTQSYMDEGPTWSPNGRVIIFARQARGAGTRLYSIDVTGTNLREVLTPMDASDPAWSPLLPL